MDQTAFLQPPPIVSSTIPYFVAFSLAHRGGRSQYVLDAAACLMVKSKFAFFPSIGQNGVTWHHLPAREAGKCSPQLHAGGRRPGSVNTQLCH